MPEGSVRALIALSVVATAVFMWATGREIGEGQWIVTTGVVGGYFALRQIGSGASKPDGQPQQNLLGSTD